jgi:hypothetical protein
MCAICRETVWRHFAAFGIGSMIYSGLEFGQYFEVERDTKCHNVLLALTPATRMAFTFIQMYFIFLNNEVRATKLSEQIFIKFGIGGLPSNILHTGQLTTLTIIKLH